MCFILSAITSVGHLGAKVGLGEPKTHFALHPVLSGVARDNIRGCLRDIPVVARLSSEADQEDF